MLFSNMIGLTNFMCQYYGAKDTQKTSKTLFLGMSVRVFLKEISTLISRLSKEDCLHQCGQALSNPLA